MANVQSTLWNWTTLAEFIIGQWNKRRKAFNSIPLNSTQRAYLALIGFVISGLITRRLISYRNSNGQRKGRKEFHRESSAALLKDGWSRELYVPTPKKGKRKSDSSIDDEEDMEMSRVIIKPTRKVTFDAHRRLFYVTNKSGSERRAGVNSNFAHEFGAIWSIIVPRLQSKTSALLFVHAIFLGLRTWLSLLVAKLDGQIVRDLIAANGKEFLKGLLYWFLLAIPASYTNSMIKFLQAKISIAFRTKLIRYAHDIYLNDQLAFYKVSNIDGGIEGADQYITADITRFCDAAAALYSSLGKPSVDFLIFSYQLQRNLGPAALFGIFGNYALTAWMLKSVAPQFGRLAAVEARLEGEYRNAHSKLITNAEEIAFYDGTSFERQILSKTYRRVITHIARILRIKVSYNMFEDFVLKYGWSALGYLFASIPVFLPTWSGQGGITERLQDTEASINVARRDFRERDRMKQFITNKRLMLSLADAGGRMMYSIKDLAELAGYTSRVYQLLSTLHRVYAGEYDELTLAQLRGASVSKNGEIREESEEQEIEEKEDAAVAATPLDSSRSSRKRRAKGSAEFTLADVRGTMQEGFDGVRFEKTPIVIPGLARTGLPGEMLIKDLDIRINPGDHILISGANGMGKSSIARVLAGLWPVYRGLVSKPEPENISFLPQRPYLSHGTLRDQMIYPDSHADMLDKGKTDEDLMRILEEVRLAYIPDREGGWEARRVWKDVFSGGEKQRVMFARILYKQPKFAIIDEGTSAVSADVEGLLYETCKKYGITLITISHRPSLVKYHIMQLKVGLGEDHLQWSLERTGTEEARLSVEKEIEELEKKLGQVETWKERRQEIVKMLS